MFFYKLNKMNILLSKIQWTYTSLHNMDSNIGDSIYQFFYYKYKINLKHQTKVNYILLVIYFQERVQKNNLQMAFHWTQYFPHGSTLC